MLPPGIRQWTQVGDTLPAVPFVSRLGIAPDGTLWLAVHNDDQKFEVRRFDGTAWQSVGQPFLQNASSDFAFGIDKAGRPFLATDTADYAIRARRRVVVSWDGTSWQPYGDASAILMYAQGYTPSLGFDSLNRLWFAFGPPGAIVRYDGTTWQRVKHGSADFVYGSMAADPSGRIYAAAAGTDSSYYYDGQSWLPLNTTGLSNLAPDMLLSTLDQSRVFLERLQGLGRDSTTLHEYTGGKWELLGAKFAPGTFLSDVHKGSSGHLYLFEAGRAFSGVRLLRFSGNRWKPVASESGSHFVSSVHDRQGNLYIALHSTGGVRVMKYDTRNDGLSVPVAPHIQSVSAVPVPTTNELLVRCTDPGPKDNIATVTDLQGRAIHRFLLTAETRIATASWPTGVYLIQLPDGSSLKVLRQ